jgi:anti-anti-sigma factor
MSSIQPSAQSSNRPSARPSDTSTDAVADTFHASVGAAGSTTVLRLAGRLTDADVPTLRALIGQAAAEAGRRLVVDVHDLASLVPAALRCLAFTQQQLPPTTEVAVEGASPELRDALERSGLTRAMTVVTTAV